MLALRVTAEILHIEVPQHGLVPWLTVVPGNLARAEVANYLQRQPGLQLAVIRYSEDHHTDEEWVHNGANIDESKIVWAREGSMEQNAQLLQYFHQRHAWLVEADGKPPRLTQLPCAPTVQDVKR
jgi:hypothetical protein